MNEPIQYLTSLVESGQRSKLILEKCYDFFPAMIYVYDLNREEISFSNKRVAEYLGYTPSEVESSHNDLLGLFFEEDSDYFYDLLKRAKTLREDESFTFTARYKHKNGTCKYLKTTVSFFERSESEKSPATILCFAENITDRVKIEEESRAARQLFDETEELLLFGTWSWTPSTEKLEWTEGMFDLLEYDPKEVEQVTNDFYTRHILPEHVETVQKAVKGLTERKEGFELEYVIRTKSGKEKYVFTKVKPLVDKDGTVKKVVGITRDITNKKNSEKERERNIRELNRSNKELEEFAYVASHDMHEPLRKILTFSERIKGRFAGALGDDGKVYLDRIASSAENMRNLIDNLLEFSKVSRGARSFTTCDLNDLLKNVISDQELRIEETGTTITCQTLPVVEAVPSEFRQLFNNLISNALKFRKKDSAPLISISARRLSHTEKADHLLHFNKAYFQIDVKDNGIGFEPVYAERIFEIFQRLHGKAEYAGSGIGLAICKKIVESHDGIIYASSQPGEGSTFSVIIPEKQFD